MAQRIREEIHLVGGPELSDPRDCLVYLIDLGELILIDTGTEPGWSQIADNIRLAGHDPADIHTCVLTHGHVDHIGGASSLIGASKCRVIAHSLDSRAIQTGDPVTTAANWYNMTLPGIQLTHVVDSTSSSLEFSRGSLTLLHTPGHTPGSMVVVLDAKDGTRVLFGQDIHGPFDPSFGSDIDLWRKSMGNLIALQADILCEGHYGVFRGAENVKEFIETQLAQNP